VSTASRSPAVLAALASVAVTGLDPASVRAMATGDSGEFDVALVVDTQDRHWVVRAPRTPAAGARLEAATTLLPLIARRLPFHVPVPKGFVAVPEGRAAVHPHLAGHPLRLAAVPAGPGLAGELGRAIAAIHNLDRALFDEAGMPVYDADTYRTRRLAKLDRAAATGHVPSALLSRWEDALDDVTLWRFAPTPVHGELRGEHLLTAFEADDDARSGRIKAVTGWEDARVADPADDFAAVVAEAPDEVVESVLEAYANARIERPDPHLRRRARLSGELRQLRRLLVATSLGASDEVRAAAGALRHLEERAEQDDLAAPEPVTITPKAVTVTAPAPTASRQAASQPDPAAGQGSRPAADPRDVDVNTQPVDPGTLLDPTEAIPAHQRAKARGGGVLDQGDAEPTIRLVPPIDADDPDVADVAAADDHSAQDADPA